MGLDLLLGGDSWEEGHSIVTLLCYHRLGDFMRLSLQLRDRRQYKRGQSTEKLQNGN